MDSFGLSSSPDPEFSTNSGLTFGPPFPSETDPLEAATMPEKAAAPELVTAVQEQEDTAQDQGTDTAQDQDAPAQGQVAAADDDPPEDAIWSHTSHLRHDMKHDNDQRFKASLGHLFENEDDNANDIEIVCLNGRRTMTHFKCHRAIVTARFPHLRKRFSWKDPGGGVTILSTHEFDSDAIWRFLTWCYTGDYPSSEHIRHPRVAYAHPKKIRDDDLEPFIHFKIYSIGKKWKIPELRLTAMDKLETFLRHTYCNHGTIVNSTREFLEIIRYAFQFKDREDKPLRDIIIKCGVRHHDDWAAPKRPGLNDDAAFDYLGAIAHSPDYIQALRDHGCVFPDMTPYIKDGLFILDW